MLVGGAMVNALAFSGSNYLFSMLRSSDLNEERKRHDQAVEQLQAAQAKWSRKRTERLDWISEDLRRQGHAVQTFRDVDDAMREYSRVTGTKLDPPGTCKIASQHCLSTTYIIFLASCCDNWRDSLVRGFRMLQAYQAVEIPR